MNAYARTSNLAAYQSTAAHGGVAAADPHRLIVMLMDGALERIATARGCMQRGETTEKARLLNRAVSMGQYTVYYNDPNLINTRLDKVAAVTKEDVQRVANKYLVDTNRTIVITTPKPKAKSATTQSGK